MQITVNGVERQVTVDCSVQQLLLQLELGTGRIAVEVNGEIVARSSFAQSLLNEGDSIEIVQAIGGG